MTRRSKREIEHALEKLAETHTLPDDPGVIVAYPGEGPRPDDVFVWHEDDKMIDRHGHIAIPNYFPQEHRRLAGVTCLSYAEIEDIWRSMPDDVLAAEQKFRLENDEPIPPILQQ